MDQQKANIFNTVKANIMKIKYSLTLTSFCKEAIPAEKINASTDTINITTEIKNYIQNRHVNKIFWLTD